MNALCVPLMLLSMLTVQAQPDPKKPAEDNLNANYEAKLNDILGKGITPERNANVLLWKALGPTPEGGTGMPAEFFKRLGIPEPPKQGDYFVGLQRYMSDRLKLDRDDWTALFDQQGRATKKPWTAKDYPQVGAWLAFNEKPLAVVIEATKRPEYYNPIVKSRTENDPGSLIGALMPGVQKCRELAAALCGRAMLRVEEGKIDEAWQDLLAAHRLGRLVARGGTLIEGLVGIAIDAIASNANLAYLERSKLTSKQLLERLKELQQLPPMPPMADKIDTGERHMGLDSIQLIRRGGDPAAGPNAKKPTPEELQGLAAIDWELVTGDMNKMYDRMAAALRIKDRAARDRALANIENELVALAKEAKEQQDKLKKFGAGGDVGKIVAKSIGATLMGLLAPAIRKVQSSFDRSEQVEHNLHVAFALAAYHRDNGRYPAKLDDLAPKYLPTVPNDLFTGKPLVYRPYEKGYLFYSVGVNGKDEEGRWVDDDPPGDDPRVRMPLPPLKRNP